MILIIGLSFGSFFWWAYTTRSITYNEPRKITHGHPDMRLRSWPEYIDEHGRIITTEGTLLRLRNWPIFRKHCFNKLTFFPNPAMNDRPVAVPVADVPVNPAPVPAPAPVIPVPVADVPVNPAPVPVADVPVNPAPVPAPAPVIPVPVIRDPVSVNPALVSANLFPDPVPRHLYPDFVPAPVIRGRVPANLYPDPVPAPAPVIRVPSPAPAPVADVPVDEMHIPRSLHATRGMEFVPYSLKPGFLRYNGPSLLYRKIYEHTENYPEFNRRFAQLLLNDNIIFYPTRPAGSDTASESETWSDSGSSSRSPSRSRSGSDSGSDTAEASNSARPTMTTMLRLNPEVQAALRNIFNDMP